MPKKKKGKPVGESSEVGGLTSSGKRRGLPAVAGRSTGGRDGGSSTAVKGEDNEEVRNQQLCYLQDMFAGKLDPVVVHMIMNDCEFNVETALETLFELADQTSATESQMFRLSGFKDVYIPRMEADDEDEEDQEEIEDSQYLQVSTFPERPKPYAAQPQKGSTGHFADAAKSLGQAYGGGSMQFRNIEPTVAYQSALSQESYKHKATYSMDTFSPRREDATPSQDYQTDAPLELDSPGKDLPGEFDSALNYLNRNKPSDGGVGSSRHEQDGNRRPVGGVIESPSKSESTRTRRLLPRFRRKADSSSPVALIPPSAADFRTQESDVEVHVDVHSKKESVSTEKPFEEDSKASFETELNQDPSSIPQQAAGGSQSAELQAIEMEALLEEIEMCPENASMSLEKPEPHLTDRLGPSGNASYQQDETEKGSASTSWEKSGFNSNPFHLMPTATSHIGEESNNQLSQVRMQALPDDQQQLNLNTSAPTFIPRAYLHGRYPPPQGYQQHQGPLFQPRHSRFPHVPGRASSSHQQQDSHPSGHFARPFFTPTMHSQEQRQLIPRTIDTQQHHSRQLPHQLRHPTTNLQPPNFRPVSMSQPPIPTWQQIPASHHPRMSQPGNISRNPPTMSQGQIMPREGEPPPERMRTNSPHEGARQPANPPSWPSVSRTSYASQRQGDGTHTKETADKVVPLPKGKVLCLMRGCPGSGKSTLARKLVGNGKILSSDNFFINEKGKYHFDVTKLSDAHDWSHQQAKDAMESGVTPLIIDNTNIERWTMKPYVVMALLYDYAVEFREPTTPWKFTLGKLFKYNTHGVPRERIKMMIERFERDVTVENILGSSKASSIKQRKAEAERRSPSPTTWRRTKKEDKGVGKVPETSWRKPGKMNFLRQDLSDALMTTLANDSLGNSTPRADKREARKEEPQEVEEKTRTASEPRTDSKSGNSISSKQTVVSSISEGADDTVKVTEGQLISRQSPEVSCGVAVELTKTHETVDGETEKDDFMSIVEAISVSLPPPSEEVSPDAGTTLQGDGRVEEQRVKSIDNEEFEALMISLAQAPNASMSGLHLDIRHRQDDATGAGDKEGSDAEDDFAAMINLVADASCVPSQQEPSLHRDAQGGEKETEVDNNTDSGPTAISLEGDSPCQPAQASPSTSKEESSVETPDDNLGKRRDDAEKITSNEGVSSEIEESKNGDVSQQEEIADEGGCDGSEDGFSAKTKEVSTSHSVPKPKADRNESVTANPSESEEVAAVLSQSDLENSGFRGNEQSSTSLNVEGESVLDDSPKAVAAGSLQCAGDDTCMPLRTSISKEGVNPSTLRDVCQQAKAATDESGLRNSNQEVRTSSSIPNEGYTIKKTVPERQSEVLSAQSVSVSDINSNHMESINHGEGTSDSQPSVSNNPSVQTEHPDVCNSEVPSSSLLPQSESPTCRSLSPSLLFASSGTNESLTKQRQDRRSLRRSRSHSKSTKMAAVFPTLSPDLKNWTDLSNEMDQAADETLNQPQVTPSGTYYIFHSEAATMTLASDFSFLQKLESGKLTVQDLQMEGLQVCCGCSREISASNGRSIAAEKDITVSDPSTLESSSRRSPIPETFKLHKSTMTDSERQIENVSEKLENLTALFPAVSIKDLEDILTACTGDLQWTTNILLDDFPSNQIEKVDWKCSDLGRKVKKDDSPNIAVGTELSVLDSITKTVEEVQVDSEALTSKAAEMLEVKRLEVGNGNASTETAPLDDGQFPESGRIDEVGNLCKSNEPFHEHADHTNPESVSLQDSAQATVSESLQEALHHSNTTANNQNSSQIDQSVQGVDLEDETSRAHRGNLGMQTTKLERLGPFDMSVAKGLNSQALSGEFSQESGTLQGSAQEAAYGISRPHLIKDDQSSKLAVHPNSVSAVLEIIQNEWQWSEAESQEGLDSQSARKEVPKEQVVRPKIPSGTSKASKKTKMRDADLLRKTQVVETPFRRDELEAIGGIQFSWNDQGKVEEFRVPRPEQMMTVNEDALQKKEESGMTEEHADNLMQDKSLPRQRKELSSLKEGLMLPLPPAFALQLQEMFGATGFHLSPDGLPAEDLQVHVDYELAKKLHSLWAQTLQTRFNREEELDSIIRADEELARKLQQEEDIHHLTEVQTARSARYQGTKTSSNGSKQPASSQLGYGDNKGMMGAFASPSRQAAEEGKGLREIMDEELAAQLSKDLEVEEKLNTEGSVSIATKLKRDKLFSKFPTLDREVLEDVFRANDYNLEPSVKEIQSIFISAPGRPKDVYTDEALDRMEKELIEAAEKESLASSEGTDDSNPHDSSYYQSLSSPDYQDYRAEATQHYCQRHEAFQKAAAAYNRGQKELASFYSQQGHLHTEKLQAANKRASEAIMTSKNSLFSDNTLDLHGLHIDEALLMLTQVLDDKKAEISAHYEQHGQPPMGKPPQRHIFVITGKGNHSRGGVARIRPAVTDLLKKEGYRFRMVNAGLMKITL